MSLKEESISEIEMLIIQLQTELLEMLKPANEKATLNENANEKPSECFFTPTKTVLPNNVQNSGSVVTLSMVKLVLESTNSVIRAKLQSQSQPSMENRPSKTHNFFAFNNVISKRVT